MPARKFSGAAHSRREMVEVCRRLYDRGLLAGQDGNVSVRIAADRVLVTPAGMSKVDVRASDLVELSIKDGHVVSSRGDREASSEVQLHLAVYAIRPDVRPGLLRWLPFRPSPGESAARPTRLLRRPHLRTHRL